MNKEYNKSPLMRFRSAFFFKINGGHECEKGIFFSIVIFSLRLPSIITFCEKAKNNEPKLINDGTNLSYFSCIKQVPHRIIYVVSYV